MAYETDELQGCQSTSSPKSDLSDILARKKEKKKHFLTVTQKRPFKNNSRLCVFKKGSVY